MTVNFIVANEGVLKAAMFRTPVSRDKLLMGLIVHSQNVPRQIVEVQKKFQVKNVPYIDVIKP